MCTGLEILALAGAGLSAGVAVASSQSQAASNEAQAEVFEQQAVRERQLAAAEEQEFRRDEDRKLGALRARLGGAGVRVFQGTSLDIAEDTAAEIELQALKIRSGGAAEATQFENRARMEKFSSRNTKNQGFMKAGARFASGVVASRGSKLIGGGGETFG